MKINTTNNVVEFVPSEKNFNKKTLKRRRSVDARITIDNKTSEFIPQYLSTPIQSQNTIITTYMNYNNNNL